MDKKAVMPLLIILVFAAREEYGRRKEKKGSFEVLHYINIRPCAISRERSDVCGRTRYRLLCLTASNTTTAAAFETFIESIFPCIGIMILAWA